MRLSKRGWWGLNLRIGVVIAAPRASTCNLAFSCRTQHPLGCSDVVPIRRRAWQSIQLVGRSRVAPAKNGIDGDANAL